MKYSPHSLAINDLPHSLREDFRARIRDCEECGFQTISINKADTIGPFVNYVSVHRSNDNKILLRINAMGMAVGKLTRGEWLLVLRTELRDGTILLTNNKAVQACMILPNNQLESLPGLTPFAELCRAHENRINSIPEEQIVLIPREDFGQFLRVRMEAELQERLALGLMRKLTEKEVEKLREIELDF